MVCYWPAFKLNVRFQTNQLVQCERRASTISVQIQLPVFLLQPQTLQVHLCLAYKMNYHLENLYSAVRKVASEMELWDNLI